MREDRGKVLAMIVMYIIMILIIIAFCTSCESKETQWYKNTIETTVVSDKYNACIFWRGIRHDHFIICLQTPRTTECFEVDELSYNSLNKGDTLKLVTKTVLAK